MSTQNDPADDAPSNCDQRRITAAVQEIAESRFLIEQTKGMLMLIYGIDADHAFDLLRWQSQQHNVKLKLIAEQILKDLVELSEQKRPFPRTSADGLLLSAHQRIAHVAARQMNGQSKTGVPMKAL